MKMDKEKLICTREILMKMDGRCILSLLDIYFFYHIIILVQIYKQILNLKVTKCHLRDPVFKRFPNEITLDLYPQKRVADKSTADS